MQITNLKDTVKLMNSNNHAERFKAEYYQLKYRYESINTMLLNWEQGLLNFEPTSPRSLYVLQLKSMGQYMTALEARAAIENIKL